MNYYLAKIRTNMNFSYRLVKANGIEEAYNKVKKFYSEGHSFEIVETLE